MSGAVIGMDVGATKCAILVEHRGEVTAYTAPSTGWDAEPVEHGADWIRETLRSILPVALEIDSLAIGAQGLDRPEVVDALTERLRAGGLPTVRCVNDGALVARAAGLAHGIGLIAGTGAIGHGTDGDGQTLLAGGWGAVIGDDAGAAAIVREATKTALLDHDDGVVDDGLLAALLTAFDVEDAERLARSVNDEPTTDHWGPRAPAVFAAADAGSIRAREVIDRAADHLVRLVTQLRARGAVGDVVVAAGSVVTAQPRLAEAVRSRLLSAHPDLGFRVLQGEPVLGALAIAREG